LTVSGTIDYNQKVLRKTYTMANIIPQAPEVNRKTWIKAEKFERSIAVPNGFWKMIYNDDKNYKKCFYYKNDLNAIIKGDKLKSHFIDCNTLIESASAVM
jgi:endonuclease G, mitochondrial